VRTLPERARHATAPRATSLLRRGGLGLAGGRGLDRLEAAGHVTLGAGLALGERLDEARLDRDRDLLERRLLETLLLEEILDRGRGGEVGEGEARDHEDDGGAGGELLEKAPGSAAAEHGLAGATAEGGPDVGPLALLEQHDRDQGQADRHVHDGDEDGHPASSSGGTSNRMIA
jgi:hypothetical protein